MGEVDLSRMIRKSFPEEVTLHNDIKEYMWVLTRWETEKDFAGEALRQKAAWQTPEDSMARRGRKQKEHSR